MVSKRCLLAARSSFSQVVTERYHLGAAEAKLKRLHSALMDCAWLNDIARQLEMHGVVIRAAGGPEMVSWQEVPVGAPSAGEVLVRVETAGVAFGDVLLRRGVAGGKFPAIPGYDLVGTVEAVGRGVARLSVGERVAAFPGIAAQQEQVVLHERDLVSIPYGIPAEKAVAAILNYLTAYQILTRPASLDRGDKVFIYGLAGGLGSAMRQVAAQLGIEVYGTASGSRMEEASRGAAQVFNREDPNWISAARQACPEGFDVVVDPIGGASLQRSYNLLSSRGTLLMIGAASTVQGDGWPRLKLIGTLARLALLKLRFSARRVRIFLVRSAKKNPDLFQREMNILFNWLSESRIDPQVYAVLPMKDARFAHEMLERGEVAGKIVLRAGADDAVRGNISV